jgi:GNAT superfamily N-acetyltransferase
MTFRRLLSEEFAAAYAIITQATLRLSRQGYRYWLMPEDVYRKRQAAGENYGLLMGGEIAVVVSLARYRPDFWQEHLPKTPFIWLASLASAEKFKGQNLGRVTLDKVDEFVTQINLPEIYLDCYFDNGFLPKYYEAAGYQPLARKELIFPDGSRHDSVLMRKRYF